MNTISVEVVLKNDNAKTDVIISYCQYFLKSSKFQPSTIVSEFDSNKYKCLYQNIDHIIIGDIDNFKDGFIDFTKTDIKWYLYSLFKNGHQLETDYDVDGEAIQFATAQLLPALEYFNLWENLVYGDNIKQNLLKYASSVLLFNDKGVDSNIISCNRVVLLYGPPGTGKTSLCKALAHKLTVRLNNHFKRGLLLEINSHSLFSKWFSESGKLVTKMFNKVNEFLKDPDTIVFILIDEIESLTHARSKCLSGTEPSDSIRVVNAILTQLDQVKNNPNVLILCTSNMTQAIDLAFVDRVDIKQYIGLPQSEAIYKIYFSCLQELFKVNIITPAVPLLSFHLSPESCHNVHDISRIKKLRDISQMSVGLSGRTLRKIPLIAHSLFLNNDYANLETFLEGITKAIEYVKANADLSSD